MSPGIGKARETHARVDGWNTGCTSCTEKPMCVFINEMLRSHEHCQELPNKHFEHTVNQFFDLSHEVSRFQKVFGLFIQHVSRGF